MELGLAEKKYYNKRIQLLLLNTNIIEMQKLLRTVNISMCLFPKSKWHWSYLSNIEDHRGFRLFYGKNTMIAKIRKASYCYVELRKRGYKQFVIELFEDTKRAREQQIKDGDKELEEILSMMKESGTCQ